MKTYPMLIVGFAATILFNVSLTDAKVCSPGGAALEGLSRVLAHRAETRSKNRKNKFNHSREVKFYNNLEEVAKDFPDLAETFKFLETAPIINGQKVAPGELRSIKIEDGCCSVVIQLRRGFVQLFDITQGFIRRLLMTMFRGAELLLRSRTFVFDLIIPEDCDYPVDVASLLATACAQAEEGAWSYQMRSPLSLEVSLAQPVEL